MVDHRSWLIERGHEPAEIDRIIADGRLLVCVVEELLLPDSRDRLTVDETVERAGTDRSFSDDIWRALGYPEAASGAEQFVEADVEALRTVDALLEIGVEQDAVLDVTRVLGASMARVAESLIDVFLGRALALSAEGATEDEMADEALRLLQVDALAALLDHVFRRQVVDTMRRRFDRGASGEHELVVGFADLTGFTSLTADIDQAQLNEVVVRFDHQARDVVATCGGRMVKTIGDEVMFVAETPEQGAQIALGICEIVGDDEALPKVKVGLSRGSLLSVMGDYFGPDVNKASRLTGHARPGSVLTSQSFHDALVEAAGESAYAWRNLERVDLKDLGPTRAWVLRRP